MLANNDKLAKVWDDYKAGILRGIDLIDEGARVVKRKLDWTDLSKTIMMNMFDYYSNHLRFYSLIVVTFLPRHFSKLTLPSLLPP